jgi:hypothetical protein
MSSESDMSCSYAEASSGSEESFDEMDEENPVPLAPKAKSKAVKAPAKKKTALATKSNAMDDDSEDYQVAVPAKPAAGKDKSVEEIYQKKTQLEHILLRPDTYSEYIVYETS